VGGRDRLKELSETTKGVTMGLKKGGEGKIIGGDRAAEEKNINPKGKGRPFPSKTRKWLEKKRCGDGRGNKGGFNGVFCIIRKL